jgi:tRNA threonylcarbamoyladenosine modification (KEOPS) complex  Pcc1 subunit
MKLSLNSWSEIMNCKCEIIIEFDSKEKVKNVRKSIEVDNFDFVKSKVIGNKLEAHIKANSISSILHTIDDYLACISVANNIVD